MFQLREYQKEAVSATLKHFRKTNDSAVIVLPTGAGKSLVIAELARLARKKILVLAHVKELVEQNHAKFDAYGFEAGIYSAGLKSKQTNHQVTFASIQSVARNLEDFNNEYSLVIIDECHRVSSDEDSQYLKLIGQLKSINSDLKVLGLTATPYRLGMGWAYQYHYHGFARSEEPRPFVQCIYELPLIYMIRRGYLTPPNRVDATIEQYDFSSLARNNDSDFRDSEVNALLEKYPRVTQGIIEQVVTLSEDRKGVMIFAATVKHAREIMGYLPDDQAALITGETEASERDRLILLFKQKALKFLVNVSVLTTGFDAPHVDFIAILRPTQSVSLYQQIVGRGLRLAEGKDDCLVIDYAGNGFDLYYPEVGQAKPDSDAVPVMVNCPQCDFANTFWGKYDEDGVLIEHYGRRCQGLIESELADRSKDQTPALQQQCSYRFRFKECAHCGAENDIAARMCQQCHTDIVDPDDMLKSALRLKDAKVIRCSGMLLSEHKSKLKVTYFDEDGAQLHEYFDLSRPAILKRFNQLYGRRFGQGSKPQVFTSLEQVLAEQQKLVAPDFVVAKQAKRKPGAPRWWQVKERIFDYQGRYRKANAL